MAGKNEHLCWGERKLQQSKTMFIGGWVDGWREGGREGGKEVKAILRIAYCNKN